MELQEKINAFCKSIEDEYGASIFATASLVNDEKEELYTYDYSSYEGPSNTATLTTALSLPVNNKKHIRLSVVLAYHEMKSMNLKYVDSLDKAILLGQFKIK